MNKKKVIAIHGGEAFSDYEAYLVSLAAKEIDSYQERPSGWRKNLPEALGPEYEVLLPAMPSSQNAKYAEWKIWFEKYLRFVTDEVQLVGHSLGAMFLVRYLSEEDVSVKIRSLHLVAGAYEPLEVGGDDGGDFYADLEKASHITQKVGSIFLYHSEDDPVVPYAQMEIMAVLPPGAIKRSFTDRNHFLQSDFPELLVDLQIGVE